MNILLTICGTITILALFALVAWVVYCDSKNGKW